MGTSIRQTLVSCMGLDQREYCKGLGWVGAWGVAWLFKHPQSGSKGYLSQILTFPYSISLLCHGIALLARSSPNSPKTVCVTCTFSRSDWFIIIHTQMRKRAFVHLFVHPFLNLGERQMWATKHLVRQMRWEDGGGAQTFLRSVCFTVCYLTL